MFLLLFQLFLYLHLCIVIQEFYKTGRVVCLLSQILWRDIVVVMIVWVARENYPSSIQIDVTIQVELVLEVSHIDSVHPDDVSNSEHVR